MQSTRLSLRARNLRNSQTQCLQRQFSQRTPATPLWTPLNTGTSAKPSIQRSTLSKSYSSGSGSTVSRLARSAAAPETYVAYGMTQKIFEACSTQADYTVPQATQKGVEVPTTASGEHLGVSDSWWYKELGLNPTFSTWSQITFLHMYLLTVRLRALPNRDSVQTYQRHLIDHFSHNAEHRMDVLHDLGSRGIRNKYLKDLFIQWRGIIAAYDEGLIKGDAVLGAAVWRNLWKASGAAPVLGPNGEQVEVEWSKVAWVVAYMRRVLFELSSLDEGDLVWRLTQGEIFGVNAVDRRMAEAKDE